MSKPTKRRRVEDDEVPTCSHDIIVFGGMCAKCGEQIDINSNTTKETTTRLTVNGGKNILLTQKGAQDDALRNVKTLMSRRKLALVLDLDHTLLHATPDRRVAERGWDQTSPDIHAIQLREKGTKRPPATHYVKLRPGVTELLKQCHECYQLYIYTHGTRQYAEAIAKVIDPDELYFQGRIISRSDNPDGMQHKELSQMFPCDDSMVLILDDRMDVWPSDLDNLIKVKPYHYFHNMADVNNASGTSIVQQSVVPGVGATTTLPSSTSTTTSTTTATTTIATTATTAVPLPNENDDELTHVTRVLLDVHAQFYQNVQPGSDDTSSSSSSSASSSTSSKSGKRRREEDETTTSSSSVASLEKRVLNQVNGNGSDVKHILRTIRHNVFNNVHLVFSGIINKKIQKPSYEHPIWQQAELFGACISNVVKKGVTHVVAQTPGTEKSMSATKLGVYVVSPLWLERSISTFQRCNEIQYGFTPLEALRGREGYPKAGAGTFIPPPKRIVAAVLDAKAVPSATTADQSTGKKLNDFNEQEEEDVGLSFNAWKDRNKNQNKDADGTKNDNDNDEYEDDESQCIIDNLMGKFL